MRQRAQPGDADQSDSSSDDDSEALFEPQTPTTSSPTTLVSEPASPKKRKLAPPEPTREPKRAVQIAPPPEPRKNNQTAPTPGPKRAVQMALLPVADDVPTLTIESFSFDSSDSSEAQAPPHPPVPEVPVAALPKQTAPPKRREYNPERWEVDTFDELKSFGTAIKSDLSKRHSQVNRAIEDVVASSLKEITDAMAKYDAELAQLRDDVMTTSDRLAKEICTKQQMVEELGTQQARHIDQMTHECDVIQKRVEEMLKRFAQQKKALLANQEKHTALFREDVLAEVKAAVTNRKRESSKQMVQKLVTLLDEL
jgi:hypothetical protein